MAKREIAPRKPDEAEDFFSLDSLKDFIRFFEKVDVAEVELKMKDKSITLHKQSRSVAQMAPAPMPVYEQRPVAAPAPEVVKSAAAPAPVAKPASNLVDITSPIVGTFYRSPDPKSPSFVNVGDTIAAGKVVCLIEAMKVFNEIKSEISGVVREICLESDRPVEFGQVLFRVEKK